MSRSIGALVPTLREIARIAASQARELNHWWLGVDHLLLALLHADCPGEAPAVLGTFGVTPEGARAILIAALGEPFTSPPPYVVWTPNAQLILQSASLECAEMEDDEATSEHVLVALTHVWSGAPLSSELDRRGVSAELVRERVTAVTEGRLEDAAGPSLMAVAPQAESHATHLHPGTLLAENPLGLHPIGRRPWGSAVFCDANGRPITQGPTLRQYFVDRDGYPVLTSQGLPVHVLTDEDGSPAQDAAGEPLLGGVAVPEGSRVFEFR